MPARYNRKSGRPPGYYIQSYNTGGLCQKAEYRTPGKVVPLHLAPSDEERSDACPITLAEANHAQLVLLGVGVELGFENDSEILTDVLAACGILQETRPGFPLGK